MSDEQTYAEVELVYDGFSDDFEVTLWVEGDPSRENVIALATRLDEVIDGAIRSHVAENDAAGNGGGDGGSGDGYADAWGER